MNFIEKLKCDICGAEGRKWAEGRNFLVLRCPSCGLLWTDRQRIQKEEYWADGFYMGIEGELKRRFKKMLKIIKKVTGKGGKALEVGSSIGAFLEVAGEMGFEIEGCDLSPRAVEVSRKKGLKVRRGTLDEHYEDESFDFVFAFNLVEHLPSPSEFFYQARRVLKEGGYLVLETPVQDSLFHFLARVSYILSGGRIKLLGLSPNDHLFRFSTKTLRVVSGKFGYRLIFARKFPSPWAEIWGKSSLVEMEGRSLYRAFLPPIWILSNLPGFGNRGLFILKKV